MMKTIGFIDFYLSEWHANNYPAWIKRANEQLGTDFVAKYAWAETDISPVDGVSTDEWCEKFQAERCATIEELCEKSDYILILAPSNPEKHLQYAEKALKYGKLTYIDKTFAENYATAEKIIALAEKHGAKFFTSSALRFAGELEGFAGNCETVTSMGSGASIDEYGIHQTEVLVSCMGVGAKRLRAAKDGDQQFITIEYADGRSAKILFCDNYALPSGFIARKKGGVSEFKQLKSEFFYNFIIELLKFYGTGKVPFDTEETVEVMKIRDAFLKSLSSGGEWTEI